MTPVPEITDADVMFGNISFLPSRDKLPEDFRRNWHSASNIWCAAVSHWFYNGARSGPSGQIIIGGRAFAPKTGVDGRKALRALRAVIGSWGPQHEHKIGGAGFLMSEWFDEVVP